MKAKRRAFRTITGQGLPCKTRVTTTDTGVTVVEMVMFIKEMDNFSVFLRKWKDVYCVRRCIFVKLETMQKIMYCLSENINDLRLHEKFPENFANVNI